MKVKILKFCQYSAANSTGSHTHIVKQTHKHTDIHTQAYTHKSRQTATDTDTHTQAKTRHIQTNSLQHTQTYCGIYYLFKNVHVIKKMKQNNPLNTKNDGSR